MSSSHVTFGRHLASNEKEVRDKTVASLKMFISRLAAASEMDFMKMWKGLFYCMWMSDKAPVQQELAQTIAELLHCFPANRGHIMFLFLRCFYRTMRREWLGLDKYRCVWVVCETGRGVVRLPAARHTPTQPPH